MTGIAFSPGATLADIPQPATSAPPAVAIEGSVGNIPRYSLENHTHESRLQARVVDLTFDGNGEAVYTFPKAYPVGVIPIVTATATNTRGAAYRYDATVLKGSTTNLAATITISKTPRTIVVSLLGAVTNLFTNPADTVTVNIMSRAPS